MLTPPPPYGSLGKVWSWSTELLVQNKPIYKWAGFHVPMEPYYPARVARATPGLPLDTPLLNFGGLQPGTEPAQLWRAYLSNASPGDIFLYTDRPASIYRWSRFHSQFTHTIQTPIYRWEGYMYRWSQILGLPTTRPFGVAVGEREE